MSANDPQDDRLWIPAFDELGAGLQRAAATRAGARPRLTRRWKWLAGVVAVAIVPGGLALALKGDEGDAPAFGTPAPPPLETQIGKSVSCQDGGVKEVTEADFRNAIAELPPIPGAPPAHSDHPQGEPIPVPPDAPLGFQFVCGTDGEVSVVEITK